MAEKKAPVMFIEACDKRPSGFVKDGTEHTPFREELNAPTVLWVNASSFACEKDQKGVRHNVKIRFINNCDIIDPVEQEKRGFKPNKNSDKILIHKGYASIIREGSTIGLYDYLEKSYYNQDNPDRPDTASARYRMVRLDKQAEELNEDDEMMADAIKLVSSLRSKIGAGKGYKYNEERIDAMCGIANVYADDYPQKVHVLMSLAKSRPAWFLETVTVFEETINTEISQALQLNVIRFDGNVAQYADGSEIIKSLGTEKLSHEAKIEKLGDYLKTKEAADVLTKFRAKVELVKSKI